MGADGLVSRVFLILVVLIGRAEAQCLRPSDVSNYDVSSLDSAEIDLSYDTWQVDASLIQCALGFGADGSPPIVAFVCPSNGTEYLINGCEPCDGETFSAAPSRSPCSSCRTCTEHGQEYASACNSTADAVCRCSAGFTNSGGICVGQACTDSAFTNDTSCAAGSNSNLIRFSGSDVNCHNTTCTQAECCEMWPGYEQSQTVLANMTAKRDALLAARNVTRTSNQDFLAARSDTLNTLMASVASAKGASFLETATTTGQLGVDRDVLTVELNNRQATILERRNTAHSAVSDKLAATDAKITAAMAEAQEQSAATTALRNHQLSEHETDVTMLTDQRSQFESAWADQLNLLSTSTGPAETSNLLTGARDIVSSTQTSYTPLIDPISG